MSKELIVSVNGREKKIAIIENEQVSEFYIERGEENQGIVGNLYKGRVMRVLPGMQSAFVDIGLERDAFLYVSDFFDEEEEFERIVMDKTKKGDAAEASRAAHERIEQARIEREHRIEASQERAEPLLDAEPDDAGDVEAIAPMLDEEEEAIEAPLPQAAASAVEEEETAEDAGGKRRSRRGRRPGKGAEAEATGVEAGASEGAATTAIDVSDIETPFVSGQASFERVVDEDERAAENGEMPVRYVETFGHSKVGDLILVPDSHRRLSLSVNKGHAFRALGLKAGGRVRLTLLENGLKPAERDVRSDE